jgi:hypothetical protein
VPGTPQSALLLQWEASRPHTASYPNFARPWIGACIGARVWKCRHGLKVTRSLDIRQPREFRGQPIPDRLRRPQPCLHQEAQFGMIRGFRFSVRIVQTKPPLPPN